ncbi:MAG TPA: polyprenyl synthetase family protein [Candidatus Bathyarchaeia archaeon]|nr:polyprenyl synthetase family protein [Candidatus Bathyarchaeia archaeon]
MKKPKQTPEAAMMQIQKIFERKGTKALNMARQAVKEERIKSRKAQQALTYFITEYWHDTARPSLMALSCEAVGGDPEITLPVAIPMILISGAIDIHDDIIDQSKSKDGRPTVYGKFGLEIALLVGDALLFKGLVLLNKTEVEKIPAETMLQVNDIIKTMFFELGDAEALELECRRQLDVSPEDYLHIVRMKAADVEAHTRISAILGNASSREVEALSEYGRLLGMMIILRDDIIDLLVPEECRSRITKECLPLPLLYGLQDAARGPELRSQLQGKTISDRRVQEILSTVRNSRAIARHCKTMEKLASKAMLKLRVLSHNTRELQLLVEAMLPATEEETRAANPSISTRAEPGS